MLRWALGLVAFAWVVVLLTWSALHVFIVPRIDDYREVLQQQATRALGLRVEIGQIRAQGGWLVPWFELNDIQLYDREGREALSLPRVLAAVSPLSMLRGNFEQLDIEQPELEIRRDANGHVWVAGLDTSVGGEGGGSDWFFSQPEFLVRGGVVHWRDETRAGALQSSAPVLTLHDVDVTIQNRWFRHDLRADVTPPEALGKRLSVRGKLTQKPWQPAGDISLWSGELFAELPYVDLATLRDWVAMDRGLSLQEGRGSVRLWSDVQNGKFTGVTADVALDAVDARLGVDLQPLGLRHVHGRIGAQAVGGEVEISSQDLVFDTLEGEHWPGGVLRVSWAADTFASGTLQADRLDLDALNQISQRLPLPEKLRAMLSRLQPQGQVNQLKATWQKNGNDILNYSARGQVRQMSLQRDALPESPLAGLPGMQAAQLEFDVTHTGGKARVSIQQGSLTLPVGLDEPYIPLTEASAQIAWQVKGPDLAVQFTQGRVVNDDVTGEFKGSWKAGEGHTRYPGVLDLTASLSQAKLAQVHRYLPNSLSAEVRAYVHDAVQAGSASQVNLRLRGNLHDMPFNDPKQGEFRIVIPVTHGQYAYVPSKPEKGKAATLGWPSLTNVNGELVFDRSALHFKGQTQLASAPDVAWQKVEAHIPDLSTMEVSVTGEGRGPLQQVLDTVAKTALNDLTGSVLNQSQASGEATYKLSLKLPVQELAKTQVQGSVNFTDNALQVIPGTPVLNRARGALQFSDSGFTLKGVKAQLLGGDATLEGGLSFTAKDGQSPLQLKIAGHLTAEGLRQARELGLVSRLAQRATGKTNYSAILGLQRGYPDLVITSDLAGMALGLPAPLNKAASAKMPLRIASQLTRESLEPKSRVLQDQISVSLDRTASVIYVRDISGPKTRVVRGGIAVGQSVIDAVPMRDNAVSLNLNLPSVDIDAWNLALTQITGSSPIKRRKPNTVVGSEADTDGAQDYMPTFAALQAGQIKVTDRIIHKVVVGGTRQGDLWRLNIGADELNGFAEVRPPSGNVPAQLFVRLAYLNIPPSSVSDVERMLTEQPSSIPTLDIVVGELTLRGKKLGRLEIDAVNRVGANASREWRLNKLNLQVPEATFTANGSWMAGSPRARQTQLSFVLAIRDSGDLLARLGTPGAIREGEGRLEGDITWQGSPITLDYASMTGKMHLALDKGQFLKTEPGAARLLGVLNLQALPRRLTLDFSDLFSDGFAFDFVRGDVRIEQGIAFTNNLQMKGVVAGALIEGSADIVKETQNLKVVVVPEINAGTASLYVATINPLIGLTSYLAQMVLSKPLIRAGTTEFHVDGTWSDPRVTKVD